ncbi:MAG: TonB family protein [Terriglobales bacterium]
MFPQPMSRSEFRPDDSSLDLTGILEQHVRAGFPPELALDLVLNELVVRAAEATRAAAAALALLRGDEMVCRAATGHLAPDLGVPLNTRDGLSGACLQTRQPQLSVDTEFDPRIDPVISRRLGIRSILIVPVFDINNSQFTGVLEVFSTTPAAFSHTDQNLLEGFAEECARIRHAAIEISQRKPAAEVNRSEAQTELILPELAAVSQRVHRAPYEAWTVVLGALAILATIAVSFLIGSRIGWLRPSASQPIPANSILTQTTESAAAKSSGSKSSVATKTRTTPGASAKSTSTTSSTASDDELVVYEKGKVVFRMKPAPNDSSQPKNQPPKPESTKQDGDAIVEASSTTRIVNAKAAEPKPAEAKLVSAVWLSPAKAETRLISRTEPHYPPQALAAHRAGNVVLEVHVAEDGTVANIRTVSGDPLLAGAATEAVRNWRYQPYRQHDHPSQFQTDVTLSFTLPN